MSDAALEAWLTAANARYSAEGVQHRGRPFRALADYAQEHHCTIPLSSPIADAVFDWFTARSPPGAMAMGALFSGAFLFDAVFWPLYIPIAFGTVRLDAVAALDTMPAPLKSQILGHSDELGSLVLYWMDCCDYAFGIGDIRKAGRLNQRAMNFLDNADREIVGAIAQLLLPRPNSKAILGLRMSTEIFMKALLVQERQLDSVALKRLGHNLGDLAFACQTATSDPAFKLVVQLAAVFPNLAERYDGPDWTTAEVWEAARLAQFTAAAVVRRYSGRDMRLQLFRPADARITEPPSA